MIGGLSGGKQTDNFEFSTGVEYSLPEAAQPDISENASVTAPAASHIARDQKTNVVQIHQETVDLTYAKQSNSGRLSGLNSANQSANPNDEKAFQIQQKLIKMARDVEFSFLNGTYNKTTDGDTSVSFFSACAVISQPNNVFSSTFCNCCICALSRWGCICCTTSEIICCFIGHSPSNLFSRERLNGSSIGFSSRRWWEYLG